MSLRRIRLIMWKEFLQLRRDPLLLRLLFAMPILQLIMFGYVVGSDVRHLSTAVVDLDHTVVSRQLVEAFSSTDYFTITTQPSSESDLKALLDTGQVRVAFVVPKGLQRRLDRGETVPLGIVVDGSDSRTASVASGYGSQVVAAFNRGLLGDKANQGAGVDATVRVMFNPSLKLVNTMIPGLIATILMLSMMSIMSQAVVRERESGTLEQMFVTPIQRGEYLLGKVLPYSIVATIQMITVAVVGRYWFGVPFLGLVSVVVAGLALFMLTSIGLGLLVSLVSRTRTQAQQTVMFILLPSMVLSGFIFPIDSMPAPVVPLTYFIPLRYALVVLRSSFIKGSGFGSLWPQMLAMAIFSAVIFAIAVSRFSKRLAD